MVYGSRLTITFHGHPYGSRSKVKVTHRPYLRHSTNVLLLRTLRDSLRLGHAKQLMRWGAL